MLVRFFLYRCFHVDTIQSSRPPAVGEFLKRILEIDFHLSSSRLEDIAALVAFAKTTPCSRLRQTTKAGVRLLAWRRQKPV